MIYLAIIISLLLMVYIYDFKDYRPYRLMWYSIYLIIFILVGGLRFRLGTDTVTYIEDFKYIPSLFQLSAKSIAETNYNFGYFFLCVIAKTISPSFYSIQIIQSIIVNCVVFYFFRKYTRHIFFAIFLYFILAYFYFIFEVMREACAVSMFLISWKYFLDNKWIKYYICVLVAISFHISAIFLVLLPVFYNTPLRVIFNFNKFFWIALAGVLVLGAYIFKNFFDIINLIALSQVQEASSVYAESSTYGAAKDMGLMRILAYSINYVVYPFVAFYLFKSKVIFTKEIWNINDNKRKLELCICLFILINFCSVYISILHRFTNYFLPFLIVMFAEVAFSKFKEKKHILKLSYAVWILLFIPFLTPTVNGYFKYQSDISYRMINVYYPYASVFNPTIDNEREIYYKHIGKF